MAEGEGVGVQGGTERGETRAASIGMTLEECIQMLSNAAGKLSTQWQVAVAVALVRKVQ